MTMSLGNRPSSTSFLVSRKNICFWQRRNNLSVEIDHWKLIHFLFPFWFQCERIVAIPADQAKHPNPSAKQPPEHAEKIGGPSRFLPAWQVQVAACSPTATIPWALPPMPEPGRGSFRRPAN